MTAEAGACGGSGGRSRGSGSTVGDDADLKAKRGDLSVEEANRVGLLDYPGVGGQSPGSSLVQLPVSTDIPLPQLSAVQEACCEDNIAMQFPGFSSANWNPKAARQVLRRSGSGVRRQAAEACAAFKCLGRLGMQFPDVMEQQVDQFIPDILKAIQLKLVVFRSDRLIVVGEGHANQLSSPHMDKSASHEEDQQSVERRVADSHGKVLVHTRIAGDCRSFLGAQEECMLPPSSSRGNLGGTVQTPPRSACSALQGRVHFMDKQAGNAQASRGLVPSEDRTRRGAPQTLTKGAGGSDGASPDRRGQITTGRPRQTVVDNAVLYSRETSSLTPQADMESCQSSDKRLSLPANDAALEVRRHSQSTDFSRGAVGDLSTVVGPSERLCSVCCHVRSSVRAAQELVRHAALLCVSKLIRALGTRMRDRLDVLLQSMFAGGINRSLLKALRLLVDCGHVRQAVQKHFVSGIQQDLKIVSVNFVGSTSPVSADAVAASGQVPEPAAGAPIGDYSTNPGQGTGKAAATPAAMRDSETRTLQPRLSNSCLGCGVELLCPPGVDAEDCLRDSRSAGPQTTERDPVEMMLLALQGAYLFGVDDSETRLLVAESVLQLVFHPRPNLRAAATSTLCRLLLCSPADTEGESDACGKWQPPLRGQTEKQRGADSPGCCSDLSTRGAVAVAPSGPSFSGLRGAARYVECESPSAANANPTVEIVAPQRGSRLKSTCNGMVALGRGAQGVLAELPRGGAEASVVMAAAGNLLRAKDHSARTQTTVGSEMSRAEQTRVWWEQEQLQQLLFLQRQRAVQLLREMFPAVSTDVAVEVRMAAVSGLEDAGDEAPPLMRSSLDLIESLLAFCLDDDAEIRRKAVSVLCR